MNNHAHLMNDPLFRQYQLERCREELRLYENYCQERNRHGCRTEPPRFNENGNITNLPHHLRRLLPVFNPPQGYSGHIGNNYLHSGYGEHHQQYLYLNQLKQQQQQQVPPPQQGQGPHNNFSVCYTLSDDPNSPARQIFESFRNHPLVPTNMTPRHVIFVYEKPDSAPIGHRNLVCSKDAAVGDYSVVRYDVETQTEWNAVEATREVSRTDNVQHLHNPISTKEPTTSNLSEPDVPEFNMAVLKVAKWLHMTKNLGDVFNAPVQTKISKKFGNTRNNITPKYIPSRIVIHPSPPLPSLKNSLESTTKSKIADVTTVTESMEKADTEVVSCATEEQKDDDKEKCSPPPSEPKQEKDQ